jgi:hypothetical protein
MVFIFHIAVRIPQRADFLRLLELVVILDYIATGDKMGNARLQVSHSPE